MGLIAHAGPGASLKVRSYFLPDETTKVGLTTWMSDYTKSPAVYYYRDPRDRSDIAAILPLGGQTTFIHPPRFNVVGDRRILPVIETGYPTIVHTAPIDPIAREKYLFEVLPRDEVTLEEAATIQAMEQG